MSLRHNARVRGKDSVDIGVNLTHVGVESRGKGNGGRVTSASAESRDVARVTIKPLESRDNRHGAVIERLTDAVGRDVDDSSRAVLRIGHHSSLAAGKRSSVYSETLDGHGKKGHRDSLTRCQEHVHLTWVGPVGNGVGKVDEVVGRIPHCGHCHDNVVPERPRCHNSTRHSQNAFSIRDGRTAKFLNNERHVTHFACGYSKRRSLDRPPCLNSSAD